jgi:predicted Zn-dependent peptidase
MLDRTSAPAAGRITNIKLTKARSTALSNGLPVHIIDAGQHDIIRLEIILKSGKWFENKNGEAFFSSQMLLEGTSQLTSRELADIFEFNGAHISIHSGIDYNALVIYVINNRLTDILGIIKDCLLSSSFQEEELTILKDIQKQQLRIDCERNSFLAGREVRKLLFGQEHPYGRALEIVNIDQDLNSGLLVEYYNQHLLCGAEIIISGKIRNELLDDLQIFNDMPVKPPRKKSHEVSKSAMSEKIINKHDSLQSSIRLGRRIIPKTHKDFIGLIILNELFGGYFGSRLMKNIREEKGYTYGIHSSIVSHLHNSMWIIGTDVKKEFVDDTINQIRLEADKLKSDPIGRDELILIRNYMMGNFLSDLETSFALADKFKNIYFFGQDYSFYDRYIETINTIGPKEIQELASKYLDMSEFKRVVVG